MPKAGPGRPPGSPNKLTAAMKAPLKELAGAYTEEALGTLATIMKDAKATPTARVAAATALLDRAHGKPTQPIEHELDLSNLTDEQLSILAVALGASAQPGQGAGGDRAPAVTH